MMNLTQACAVVAQQRPADSLLVSTMGAMFAFDRIELEAAGGDASRRPPGRISSVPLMGGAAGLGRWFNKAFTRSPDPARRWNLRGYSGRGITGYASLQ